MKESCGTGCNGAVDPLTLAKGCRHYGMCRIDFLGSGVCASGLERHFAGFYPVGRMDLYAALAEGRVPVTEGCVEIADTCNLCGKCDFQCSFVTGMRPVRVMEALKAYVTRHLAIGGEIVKPRESPLLSDIREIVGHAWATSDPALTVAYSSDPCPMAETAMPLAVVLPGSAGEIAGLMKLFHERGIPWVVRGNGTNILGFTLTDGVVIDLNRMKDITFDETNWSVRIGPGVSAYDLQREAVSRGYRVHVAEPAALVCASIMCSGIVSLFATAYGTSAENITDGEFVSPEGRFFTLNDKHGPNLFAFEKAEQESPGICTAAHIRLHPMTDDESGVLVPFQSLDEAVAFSKECAKRRIGLAIGVLGIGYVSNFIAPTRELAMTVREILRDRLGISYLVLVLGDAYALRSVAMMGRPLIDQRLFRALSLGLTSLASAGWLDLVAGLSEDEPFSYLSIEGFTDLAETALAPSAKALTATLDADMRSFFEEVYSWPEMTDLVSLNMFRITSSRIGREKHFVPLLMYLPLDPDLITKMCADLKDVADRLGLANGLGFITPVDEGKRCIYEYDYFLDQNDPDEQEKMGRAMAEASDIIEAMTAETGTIRWLKYVRYQGFSRMANLLYT